MVNKKAVVEAIRQAELSTTGEVCVHLRKKCKEDVLSEGKTFFTKAGLHKTKQRNAVLIFIALESRRFAIIGDSGIHEKVGDHFWGAGKELMLEYFKRRDIQGGLIAGIRKVGEQLKAHFPCLPAPARPAGGGRPGVSGNANELSNVVTED